MKPLNRPMFRYGGPIKEGVMSGIREPKKNGGPINEPQAINTVGSPLAPQGSDGRQQYALPLLAPLAMQGLRMAARPFGKFVMRQMAGPVKRSLPIKNLNLNLKGTPIKGGLQAERFDPNRLGQAFINDPLAKSVMTGSSFVGRGIKAGGKGIYNVGKYATTTPSGLTFLGAPVAYQAGKYFLSSGEEIKDPNDIKKIKQGRVGTSGAPGGGHPGMYLTPQAKGGEQDPSLSTKSAEELKKERIQKYRDIMDIKGMNKDAAYNSLIAASQAINESGDFKGDIKSGKLINQIIQATSKQFDKPKATKDAIDTLILKGEIEKDLKASDPAAKLAAELTGKRIALADKQLKGDTLEEVVTASYVKNGIYPTGSNLAGLARTKGIDVKMVIKTDDINNFIEQNPGKDAVDFMESQVLEATKAGTPVEPGAYVVKDRIIVIDSEGNVSPYL